MLPSHLNILKANSNIKDMLRDLLTIYTGLATVFCCNAQQAIEADHARISYGQHDRQVMHLWLPQTPSPSPLVVHFHGGGFVGGDIRNKTKSKKASTFIANGIAYADVEYRLLKEAMLHDILRDGARAIQFLRHHAVDYGLDKKRVGAFGESAGAGVSLWLATHDDLADPMAKDPVLRESSRLTVAGGFSVQATYDLVQWPSILDLPENETPYMNMVHYWKNHLSGAQFESLRKDQDMLLHMDSDDPPMIFTHGSPDKGVHSQRFVDILKDRAEQTGAQLHIQDDRNKLLKFITIKLKEAGRTIEPQSNQKLVFPKHWGRPPKFQTRDYRKLPGDFGYGSSTLAHWIQSHMKADLIVKKPR
jgi:hypothetical protein